MRRLDVVLTAQAKRDLEGVFDGILAVSQNVVTATQFYRRILLRCQRIGLVPYGGRPRDDLESGLRTVPFEHSAIIAYRVEITNIFYGGRDYEALFRPDEPAADDED